MAKIITADVKVDHEGHMYGSVSQLDIVHLVKNQLGIELENALYYLSMPLSKQVLLILLFV